MSWQQKKLDQALRILQNVSAPPIPSTDFVRMKAKGKGKGGKAGGYPSRSNPGVTCKCCGGVGHFRGDCRHQGKTCNTCGKTGHLAAVCRNGAEKEANTPDSDAGTHKKKSYMQAMMQTAGVPWHCHNCRAKVFDQKLNKCNSCHTKRLLDEKQAPPPKSSISKDVLQKMEAGLIAVGGEETKDDVVMETEVDKEQMKELHDVLKLAKHGWKEMQEDAEKRWRR